MDHINSVYAVADHKLEHLCIPHTCISEVLYWLCMRCIIMQTFKHWVVGAIETIRQQQYPCVTPETSGVPTKCNAAACNTMTSTHAACYGMLSLSRCQADMQTSRALQTWPHLLEGGGWCASDWVHDCIMDASVDAVQLCSACSTGASRALARTAGALACQACLLGASFGRAGNTGTGLAKERLLLDLFWPVRAQSSIPSICCVVCQSQELSYRKGKLAKVFCLNAPECTKTSISSTLREICAQGHALYHVLLPLSCRSEGVLSSPRACGNHMQHAAGWSRGCGTRLL